MTAPDPRPDAGRRAAVVTLIAVAAVLAAPLAGRAGHPTLASGLAVVAGLAGVAAFGHALWTTASRRLAPDGGAS